MRLDTSQDSSQVVDFHPRSLEERYGARTHNPMPVVLTRGEGVYVWDVDGVPYLDCISAFSAVNQGHCHPKIVAALAEQAGTLSLTSRAFHSDVLGAFQMRVAEQFGYDRVLPLNSGTEAVEAALKLARKWAYEVKGVAPNAAKIIVCDGAFHGTTTTLTSILDHSVARSFGPGAPGFVRIPFDDVEALDAAARDPDAAAFVVEPILCRAGVLVPNGDYLGDVARICRTRRVLLVADEVQTGLGRTGRLLACDHEGVRPDVLILGKALGGGVYPVSAVLADDAVMGLIGPGDHGSTFGGNPLAARVAIAALDVIDDERLIENADRMGQVFRKAMNELAATSELLVGVRGKGLLNALVLKSDGFGVSARDICDRLRKNGLLAGAPQPDVIRCSPPLVITEDQMAECVGILRTTLEAIAG